MNFTKCLEYQGELYIVVNDNFEHLKDSVKEIMFEKEIKDADLPDTLSVVTEKTNDTFFVIPNILEFETVIKCDVVNDQLVQIDFSKAAPYLAFKVNHRYDDNTMFEYQLSYLYNNTLTEEHLDTLNKYMNSNDKDSNLIGHSLVATGDYKNHKDLIKYSPAHKGFSYRNMIYWKMFDCIRNTQSL